MNQKEMQRYLNQLENECKRIEEEIIPTLTRKQKVELSSSVKKMRSLHERIHKALVVETSTNQ